MIYPIREKNMAEDGDRILLFDLKIYHIYINAVFISWAISLSRPCLCLKCPMEFLCGNEEKELIFLVVKG